MDPPTKKDKGASAPEARVCGHCLAPEGQGGVTLTVCPQCKLTPYCSKPCQTAHWKAGHKQHCLTPKQAGAAAGTSTRSRRAGWQCAC